MYTNQLIYTWYSSEKSTNYGYRCGKRKQKTALRTGEKDCSEGREKFPSTFQAKLQCKIFNRLYFALRIVFYECKKKRFSRMRIIETKKTTCFSVVKNSSNSASDWMNEFKWRWKRRACQQFSMKMNWE